MNLPRSTEGLKDHDLHLGVHQSAGDGGEQSLIELSALAPSDCQPKIARFAECIALKRSILEKIPTLVKNTDQCSLTSPPREAAHFPVAVEPQYSQHMPEKAKLAY